MREKRPKANVHKRSLSISCCLLVKTPPYPTEDSGWEKEGEGRRGELVTSDNEEGKLRLTLATVTLTLDNKENTNSKFAKKVNLYYPKHNTN